jgi:hypothetical protein
MKVKISLVTLICMYFIAGVWAQTEKQSLPVLNGEWKLDSIVQIQGENKRTVSAPKDIIPEDIYYSCPVKIVFKEQAGNCQMLYDNEETKNIIFYVYEIQNSIRFHASLENNTPVPKWMFDYCLTATQDHLILHLEHNTETSGPEIIYRGLLKTRI